MKLIFKGNFNGNPDSLPCNEHRENAVKYKEFDSPDKLAAVANLLSVMIGAATIIAFILRCNINQNTLFSISIKLLWASILSLLSLIPHEFLHAICFKDKVYFYTYLKKMMLFVTGPEDMTKNRFIFMSLLPNIIFGLIPYIIAMINPSLVVLGFFGAASIAAGIGDYINVFNTIRQVPKGALIYSHGFNSYWYIPKEI